MELIDRIEKEIDDRLEELRPQIEEIPRLEAALAALDATSGDESPAAAGERSARGRGRATSRPSAPAARPGRPRRARRGQRREELLQLIRGNPEITIAKAARQMGVSPPQVSTLVRRLREEGALERSDGRFVVVEPTMFAGEEEASGAVGGDEAAAGGAPGHSETDAAASPEAEDDAAASVSGPGVEGLAASAGADGTDEATEAARDEAGRPEAT
jgi:transposase-like protein